MGQKVNPLVLRIGYIKNWRSLWFTDKKEFAKNVCEDYKIRNYIKKKFEQAAISSIAIERLAQQIRIKIGTARPGVLIGRRGADLERLKQEVSQLIGREKENIVIDIDEIKNPAIDAQLIAQNVAFQLARRVAFRRAMKRAIDQSVSSGAKGVKISCSGRLGGVEMSRKEKYQEGKLPLHTLRADIDYGFAEAHTTYGVIGVKAWVYKGDILPEKDKPGLTDVVQVSK